jgi:surface protein
MKTIYIKMRCNVALVVVCLFALVQIEANDYKKAEIMSVLHQQGVLQAKGFLDTETLTKLYDFDKDCVSNYEDASPTNPNNDSDGDGISNKEECLNYSDPLDANSQPLVFKIKVRTSNSGSSTNSQFTLPTHPFLPSNFYRYNVDCDSDGIYEAREVRGAYTCNYIRQGDYTISIVGIFSRIFFNNENDKEKLLEVLQWGKSKWFSMSHAFDGCSNMKLTATDTPDLSNVSSMKYMFKNARTFNGDINNWDVSHVTNMEGLFMGATAFNRDLFWWDTSNVTTMTDMFRGARSFNKFLSTWDTSSVEVLSNMFKDAVSFNSSVFGWDLQSVVDMHDMF